ncbi:MAG: YaaL family protein [Acetobacteraceae bacterium]|nr:YaaL family protein [Acetobacteraceae bacterium]
MGVLWNRVKLVASALAARAWPDSYPVRPPAVPDLATALEQARREWIQAREFFDAVSDPDLVDFAVYSVQAAERKYNYLLRQARRAL